MHEHDAGTQRGLDDDAAEEGLGDHEGEGREGEPQKHASPALIRDAE